MLWFFVTIGTYLYRSWSCRFWSKKTFQKLCQLAPLAVFWNHGVGRRSMALNPGVFRPSLWARPRSSHEPKRTGVGARLKVVCIPPMMGGNTPIGMTFGSNGRDPSYPQGISTPDFLFPDDALNSSCTFSLRKGVELRFYDSLWNFKGISKKFIIQIYNFSHETNQNLQYLITMTSTVPTMLSKIGLKC